uniref:XK-related protein n=1 Tax=Phallusia mammillata TaxID=59560 RepID=A0A6F9DIQ4_9ASCI|nr:uncharacterized protein LOC100183252 [Phallusia mammillata]
MGREKQDKCCAFEFPDIPTPWLLFIEFAFTFGTTIVYFADIVTDFITLRVYWINGWYYAFGISLSFIILPSILLAVLEYRFLKKTHGKKFTWKTIIFRTILNIPLQLTLIWYHCRLSYTFFSNWLDHVRGVTKKRKTPSQWYDPTTLERSRGASLSSLNELEYYHRTGTDNNEDSNLHDSAAVFPPANMSLSMHSLAAIDGAEGDKEKSSWWQRLTREQWLSHLNTMKLSESMLESLPQLLINLYLIAYYKEAIAIQYLSAVLSYLSLCGGVVRYDKTRKDNEADQWMVDRTLLHSRASHTRLEWPQILFVTLYKGSFLAARILAFVFFTLFYSWYILIPILIHWGVILCYFVYRWYPDFSKVTRQLQQADYKYRAYLFLSHDFLSVFHASLMAIFIHVRPYYHAFIDQPYCFMFWYYVVYVTENIALFLLPGIILSLQGKDDSLNYYQYYILMATDLFLNAAGCALCTIYYLAVHKMRAFTAHAYPTASNMLCCCCGSRQQDIDDDEDYWLPVRSGWTVCKQAETSEIFFLTKDQLKSFHQTYNTVVRKDRLKGRAVECFIDDRCKIFYAPRSKMKPMKDRGYYPDTLPRPSLRKLKDPAPAHNDLIPEEEVIFLEEHDPPEPRSSRSESPERNVAFNVEEMSPETADVHRAPEEPAVVKRPVPKARTSIKKVRPQLAGETSQTPLVNNADSGTNPISEEAELPDVSTEREYETPRQLEDDIAPKRPTRSKDSSRKSSGKSNRNPTFMRKKDEDDLKQTPPIIHSPHVEKDASRKPQEDDQKFTKTPDKRNRSNRRMVSEPRDDRLSSKRTGANREGPNVPNITPARSDSSGTPRSSDKDPYSSRSSGSRKAVDSYDSRAAPSSGERGDETRSSSSRPEDRRKEPYIPSNPPNTKSPRIQDDDKIDEESGNNEDITNELPGWQQTWI